MENLHLLIIKSAIKFLTRDLTNPNLSSEQRNFLETAIQCIESVYCLDECQRNDPEALDLLGFLKKELVVPNNQQEKEVSDEDRQKAEMLKNEGNEAINAQHFTVAVEKYSEAIILNPHHAIYFCNRAAAYSHIYKHEDAIADCKMAIKLAPNYAKAYARLGSAQSFLGNFEEAKLAFVRASELDPNNVAYKENRDRAEKLLVEHQNETTEPLEMVLEELVNSSNAVDIARDILNNPEFHNIIAELMHVDEPELINELNVSLQPEHQLAAEIESTNPALHSFDLQVDRTDDLNNNINLHEFDAD